MLKTDAKKLETRDFISVGIFSLKIGRAHV